VLFRLNELESEVARLREIVNAQAKQIVQGTNCKCDTFPTGNITVGTPSTGRVNGVNIVELSKSAIRNTGDQTISGTLSVEKLQIGNQWTLSVSPDGGLFVSSPSTSFSLSELSSSAIRSNVGDQKITGRLSVDQLQVGNTWIFVVYNGQLTANSPSRTTYLSQPAGWCECQQVDMNKDPWARDRATSDWFPQFSYSRDWNAFGTSPTLQYHYVTMCKFCLTGSDGSYERILATNSSRLRR